MQIPNQIYDIPLLNTFPHQPKILIDHEVYADFAWDCPDEEV